MDRYIDKDKIFYRERMTTFYDSKPIVEKIAFQQDIEKIPVEEVTTIIHAHWFESYQEGTGAKCSNCSSVIFSYEIDYQDVIHDYNYCPYCGAKMDEVPNE